MSNINLSVSDIKDIMEKFAKEGLTSFELEDGDFTLKMGNKRETVIAQAPAPAIAVSAVAASAEAAPAAPAEKTEELCGTVVKSPIVGTFYAAASPEKPAFVKEGQKVKKGDVMFIIESMKLMNEIPCECDGVIGKILVENGQAVEFGQPILTIE